jgi:hypothetical protein
MTKTSRTVALLIGGLMSLSAGSATARECHGISLPDQVEVGGTALALNGLGLRKATILRVKVYVGGLYIAAPSSDANSILAMNGPFEIVLHFVHDAGADDLRGAWSEGFEKNAKAQLPALNQRIATLNGWMSDVKVGQKMVFTFKPGSGLQVAEGGVVKGTIKGDDFARAFLSIWLGDPPNPDLKSGLLGGACS